MGTQPADSNLGASRPRPHLRRRSGPGLDAASFPAAGPGPAATSRRETPIVCRGRGGGDGRSLRPDTRRPGLGEGAALPRPLPLPHRGGQTPVTPGRLAAGARLFDALHTQAGYPRGPGGGDRRTARSAGPAEAPPAARPDIKGVCARAVCARRREGGAAPPPPPPFRGSWARPLRSEGGVICVRKVSAGGSR